MALPELELRNPIQSSITMVVPGKKNIDNVSTLSPTKTADSKGEDRLFADPRGWTSNPASLNSVARMLAGTVDAKNSDVTNILEEEELDQYVFSCKNASGTESFYLFSGGSADTYQVENPRTQQELWDTLKYDDWRARLKLREL